jgi:hypothetical protein
MRKEFLFRHAETTVFGVITAVLAVAVVWNASAANAEALKKAEAAIVAEARDAQVLARALEVKIPTKEDKLAAYALRRDQLSAAELKELLSLVGFEGSNLKEAWAVAMKESTGRPKSHNGNSGTGDNSYGLFQINMIGGLGEDRREKFDLKQNSDLWNPVLNAQIAHYMSGGGEDWGSWGIGANAYNGGKAGSYYDWLSKYPKE